MKTWIIAIANAHLERWTESDKATLREWLSAQRRPDVNPIPMSEHLAQLPPAPPAFTPEWENDDTWTDDR
jgi:hypothetical protein